MRIRQTAKRMKQGAGTILSISLLGALLAACGGSATTEPESSAAPKPADAAQEPVTTGLSPRAFRRL